MWRGGERQSSRACAEIDECAVPVQTVRDEHSDIRGWIRLSLFTVVRRDEGRVEMLGPRVCELVDHPRSGHAWIKFRVQAVGVLATADAGRPCLAGLALRITSTRRRWTVASAPEVSGASVRWRRWRRRPRSRAPPGARPLPWPRAGLHGAEAPR